MRLYFGHIDPRPYAVCSEAVGDMRRVTMRAPGNLTYSAMKAILDAHGYMLREKSGILLVCGKQSASYQGHVDVTPGGDGTSVYTARPQRASGEVPPADTWGPPVDMAMPGPLTPPSETIATPVVPAPLPTTPRLYRPLWRSPGELMPVVSQTGLGRILNVTSGGGAPTEFSGNSGGQAGTFLQATSEYIAWQGTDDEWSKLCPLIEQLDTKAPSIQADVYVFSVGTTKADSDGVAVVGRAAGLDFGIGTSRSNSVGLGIGSANLVLSSVRTSEAIKLVQHYSAQLIHSKQQMLNSGASVPISADVVDLEGGKTRQSTEYRNVGTNVSITPHILRQSVQLDLSIELSSVSSLRTSGNANPTFNSEKVMTTVDARPGTVSFVSALSSQSQSRAREKFFFIPIGRTDEARTTDIVYMIVLHDLASTSEADRKSVCPVIEEEAPSASRPRHCTDGAPKGAISTSPQDACVKA